jgi:hypothetical protein
MWSVGETTYFLELANVLNYNSGGIKFYFPSYKPKGIGLYVF